MRQNPLSLVLEEIPLPYTTTMIPCDTSQKSPRPFVSVQFRRAVFDSLHDLSHPGIRATQRLVTDRFVWPGINADVRRWAKQCRTCQAVKVTRYTRTAFQTCFDHVHLGLVGPLPPTQGYRYLLTCVDRYSRWPEATPILDIPAGIVAQAFVATWVSRYGCPLRITTDHG
ncbi:protein NYNRIN-like [Rhipicephalus microplus]|uniref:protein NYNRIN-like n=1 Tax=Rhipicephalus microplus TaxID=6941 RepID=UPI003F6D3DB7